MAIKGTILVGKHTAGHKAWLEGHGYKVTQNGDTLTVEGNAFVENIDLNVADPVAVVKQVIEAKNLLTYKTKATIQGGAVRSSIMLCQVLGPASALMVKPEGSGKKVASPSPFANV